MFKETKILPEIKKMLNLLKRYAHQELDCPQKNDLTPVQMMILGYISESNDRDIFQKDIEAEFNIRRSTATNIIQIIEEKGYITRETVKNDARLKKIILTEQTKKISKELMKKMVILEEKMKSNITDEEFEVFFKVLEKINRNIEEK